MDSDLDIDSVDPAAGGRLPAPDEVVWHAGWAVGAAAAGALLLLAVDGVSAQVLLALTLMAFPGIVGAFWRPRPEERFALVALWSLGAALAVSVSGGLAGPLAVLCVAPVFAGLAIGVSWRVGAGLALGVVAFCALVGALHLSPAPPAEPVRTWLALIVLLLAALGAGGAVLLARRRAEAAQAEIEDELYAVQTLMGDLPELGVALNAQGRTEAVFGQVLEHVDMQALHADITRIAAPADRPRLAAAVAAALAGGTAQAAFASATAPGERLTAMFQRTGEGGLVAILRKAPPPAVAAPSEPAPSEPAPASDLPARLAAAEAARHEAELGRDKAEANATARARFLANMSHELRTPLNAIMGFSDMMRAKMFGELPPKYAEYAELIHESGGHLLDLINDVLDMSKIEAQRYTLAREVFDVRDALLGALRLMRLQADDVGVKLRSVLPPEPLMVDADKRAIKQIALNLISNALKFTPKDGTVILTAQAAAGALEMVVADTGTGIAADDLKRLGQPFEQAGGADDRARGTGLGLSLVAAFAKLHGGSLTLESRLGEGTAATVRMPVLVAAPVRTADPEPTPEPVAVSEPPVDDAVAALPQADPEPTPDSALPEMTEPKVEPAIENEAEMPGEPASEPPPAVSPFTVSPPDAEPPPAASAPAASTSDAEPPLSLGPLESRAAEHHGLRETVISIFSRRPLKSEPASSEGG